MFGSVTYKHVHVSERLVFVMLGEDSDRHGGLKLGMILEKRSRWLGCHVAFGSMLRVDNPVTVEASRA